MFENRVLRQIYGSKEDEITGACRRLHNDGFLSCELFAKYYPGNQIRKNVMGGAYGMYGGEMRTGFW